MLDLVHILDRLLDSVLVDEHLVSLLDQVGVLSLSLLRHLVHVDVDFSPELLCLFLQFVESDFLVFQVEVVLKFEGIFSEIGSLLLNPWVLPF